MSVPQGHAIFTLGFKSDCARVWSCWQLIFSEQIWLHVHGSTEIQPSNVVGALWLDRSCDGVQGFWLVQSYGIAWDVPFLERSSSFLFIRSRWQFDNCFNSSSYQRTNGCQLHWFSSGLQLSKTNVTEIGLIKNQQQQQQIMIFIITAADHLVYG